VARLDDQNSSEEEGEEEGEGKSHEPVNVRVTVHSLKHLPRMDKFGKVDAYMTDKRSDVLGDCLAGTALSPLTTGSMEDRRTGGRRR